MINNSILLLINILPTIILILYVLGIIGHAEPKDMNRQKKIEYCFGNQTFWKFCTK